MFENGDACCSIFLRVAQDSGSNADKGPARLEVDPDGQPHRDRQVAVGPSLR